MLLHTAEPRLNNVLLFYRLLISPQGFLPPTFDPDGAQSMSFAERGLYLSRVVEIEGKYTDINSTNFSLSFTFFRNQVCTCFSQDI